MAELAQSFTYRVECERKSQPQAPAVAGRSQPQAPTVARREPKASEPDEIRRGPSESELSRARTDVIEGSRKPAQELKSFLRCTKASERDLNGTNGYASCIIKD